MKRRALVLVAAIVLVTGGLALWWGVWRGEFVSEERTGALRVQPQARAIAAQPDDFVTLVFVVQNESTVLRALSLQAEAPAGWALLEFPNEIALDAEQSQEIFLTVQIPPGTPPGRYLLALKAQDASGSALGRTQIAIPAVERLKLTLPREQPMLRPGEERALAVTVTNRGNVRLNVQISVTAAPAGWRFSLSRASVSLEPGRAESVELRLRAPERGLAAPAVFSIEAVGGRASERATVTVVLAAP
ncbi:MAG: NEW3 domain-containing protein [Candidatus Bipolaricaulota bacterium]|nr:NEW3 domain-containing protein [Candidatus Bipolaricaulota bacterium]MDW8110468.1 NEW3 domain-containing protein [Candidatus Bipolaricaulota bacterium]